ncbi:MAG: spore coat associated protein CotJA [Anaerostipes sp.]|jgi:hypothetical protein|nr:spore coat associated protein CotJA [Anaerostipes sp.]MDD3745075.1 spore coat associated protein CotJA [Anaerostipes sp.]
MLLSEERNEDMERYYKDCHCSEEQNKQDIDSLALAMAYVPWQHWNHVYSPEEGIRCGTIFPELNKPFYGRAGCRG